MLFAVVARAESFFRELITESSQTGLTSKSANRAFCVPPGCLIFIDPF